MPSTPLVLQHFGLAEDPFGVTPDPRFVCFLDQYRNVVTRLHEAIVNSRCFGVIAGSPGMGKTTLMQYLDEELGQQADFGLLNCGFDNKEDLLYGAMASLGVMPESGGYFANWLRLHSHLLDRYGQHRRVVLIYDEAHRLSTQMLEAIRLFGNLETTRAKLLQIVLCGHSTLLQKINSPELEQLGQRVTVSAELHPMSFDDVQVYVEHRLAVAGRTRRLFAAEAVGSITRLSRGIPRNINRICFSALNLACARGRQTVDAALVDEACSEFKAILWTDSDTPPVGPKRLSLPAPIRRRSGHGGPPPQPPRVEDGEAMFATEPMPSLAVSAGAVRRNEE